MMTIILGTTVSLTILWLYDRHIKKRKIEAIIKNPAFRKAVTKFCNEYKERIND